MCGIWVSINFEAISEKFLSCIDHRGPDSTKLIQFDEKIYFGFNRLSIIDLNQRSDQPMVSSDRRFVIVFNGEIYNYKELRIQLEKLGYEFRTQGDTEVLLNAFINWGEECLNRLNGMFAFLVYDRHKRRLFASRDRFGIKPLYFYQNGDKIAFASEIKQFLELSSFPKKINQERSIDFICWRLFNHSNDTMWENVYQLRGGESVSLSLDEKKLVVRDNIIKWYSYDRLINLPTQNMSINDSANEFRKILEKSIKIRLRADVDIATSLSGGIDSSSLSCIINSISDNSQTTFSLRSSHPEYDEFHYAKEVINSIETSRSHEIYLEPDNIFQQVEELVWYMDEPFSSTSIVGQNNLFEAISNNKYKVALNGQGADEVLGNYGEIRPFLNQLYSEKRYINIIRELNSKNKSQSLKMSGYYKIARYFLSLILSNFNHKNLSDNNYIDVFKGDFNSLLNNPHNYLAQEHGLNVSHNFREYNILLLMFTHLPMLLQYEDRTSMRYSVESRVPFLDYKLVEFVLSLPAELKIRNGLNKFVLRESVKDILPENIYNRVSKLGYATPSFKWSTGSHRDDFKKLLMQAGNSIPFLDVNKINLKFNNSNSVQLNSLFWRIIIFHLWSRKFNIQIN